MSDLRKAAQDVVTVWKMYGTAESLRGWMQILEAALAQQPEPAQEPIGWLNGDDEYADFMHRELARIHQQRGSSTPKFFTIPVYTKPFRSKPLTDEEIRAHADKHLRYQPQSYEASGVFDLARAIERKVRGE